MSAPADSDELILALPSKGRLFEQLSGHLADAGFAVQTDTGARGYTARLSGMAGVAVRLASAGEIPKLLRDGEVHLGVTGEDLLRELGPGFDRIILVKALGFGRADLVLACPAAWLDVETMADFATVARTHRARTGRRLRVATKYHTLARSFFTAQGFDDYRLIDSQGATEGAPAAGLAEAVIDITTSGATLAANHLRPLRDGVILRSQAYLAASQSAVWSAGQRARAGELLRVLEARQRAQSQRLLRVPVHKDAVAAVRAAMSAFHCRPAGVEETGLLALFCPAALATQAALALEPHAAGPIGVFSPDFVFENASPAMDRMESGLAAALGQVVRT